MCNTGLLLATLKFLQAWPAASFCPDEGPATPHTPFVAFGSSLNRHFMYLSADRWRPVFIMCEHASAEDVNSGMLATSYGLSLAPFKLHSCPKAALREGLALIKDAAIKRRMFCLRHCDACEKRKKKKITSQLDNFWKIQVAPLRQD